MNDIVAVARVDPSTEHERVAGASYSSAAISQVNSISTSGVPSSGGVYVHRNRDKLRAKHPKVELDGLSQYCLCPQSRNVPRGRRLNTVSTPREALPCEYDSAHYDRHGPCNMMSLRDQSDGGPPCVRTEIVCLLHEGEPDGTPADLP